MCHAVITAKGETHETKSIAEETSHGASPARRAESQEKGHRCATCAHVAPKKAKAGKKASPAKKAPKGATKAKGASEGSKTAKILDLLKRPGGVSSRELMKSTGWQAHSVRGFLSGTVRKKMG